MTSKMTKRGGGTCDPGQAPPPSPPGAAINSNLNPNLNPNFNPNIHSTISLHPLKSDHKVVRNSPPHELRISDNLPGLERGTAEPGGKKSQRLVRF